MLVPLVLFWGGFFFEAPAHGRKTISWVIGVWIGGWGVYAQSEDAGFRHVDEVIPKEAISRFPICFPKFGLFSPFLLFVRLAFFCYWLQCGMNQGGLLLCFIFQHGLFRV